jgi:hypothetical protein
MLALGTIDGNTKWQTSFINQNSYPLSKLGFSVEKCMWLDSVPLSQANMFVKMDLKFSILQITVCSLGISTNFNF